MDSPRRSLARSRTTRARQDPGQGLTQQAEHCPFPWPRTVARTLSGLFLLPRRALHLPRYPLYAPGEPRRGDYEYFFRRCHRYLSCQAARFLLFGGDFLTLADEAAVDLAADLSGFWSGFYREHFPDQHGEVLRYQGHTGYRDLVAKHSGHRIVSPHPFDSAHIPAERYYLDDPDLVVRLNDKGRIGELTGRVPRAEVLGAAAFARGLWRGRWPLPFVLKIAAPSGGGDGVALCEVEADVREARSRFAGHRVKVEQLIGDIRNNFNIQLQVAPNGEVAYIGGSVQRVEGGRYGGNLIDPQWVPPRPVARVCDQAARAAAALGWHGVCGLDLLEDAEGEVWLIDPNFRLNGSTPFFFLGDYLATRHRRPQLATGYFHYAGPPVELLDRFRREIHRRELVPIGACYDSREDGVTRLYAAVVSDDDPQAIPGLVAALAARGLAAGIGL